MLLETSLQGVLIFFTPRALRLLGALGMGQSTAHPQNSTFANLPTAPKPKFAKELFFLPSRLPCA